MDMLNLKAAWESCDARLEKSIRLNLRYLEQIQTEKLRSNLSTLFTHRIIEMIFHLLAILLLSLFLVKNINEFKYAFSAIALLAFYLAAVIKCFQQLHLIQAIDYNNDILFIQRSILKLRTHMLDAMRMAVLFIPAFIGFALVVGKAVRDLNIPALGFLDVESQYDGNWWQLQAVCMAVLTPLCIGFYWFVSEKQIHRPWVRKTILMTAGSRIAKSLDSINDLKDIRKDMLTPAS